jgi:flagellar hook-associated protein 2
MRNAVSDVFSGNPAAMNQMSELGLSTGNAVGTSALNQDSLAGKLTLDTSKLQAALSSNFNNVKTMFSNAGANYGANGLSQRLDNIINGQIAPASGMLVSRMASEDSLISLMTQQQTDIQQRLDMREATLRAQFTAMESALSQNQSQSSWLSSQIASLG